VDASSPPPLSNSLKSWLIVAGAFLAATVMFRLPLSFLGIFLAYGAVNLFRRPTLMGELGRMFAGLAHTR
jgi:hypothetical protein